MEYLLKVKGFDVEGVFTSVCENHLMLVLKPLIALQMRSKEYRSAKKGGIDYSRINKILLSDEILLGRHLILKAVKSS